MLGLQKFAVLQLLHVDTLKLRVLLQLMEYLTMQMITLCVC